MFAGAVAQASPHGLQLGVQAVVYHGGYLPFRDPNSEENSNDIALVHLSSPLPLTGKSGDEPWPWGLQRLGGERTEPRDPRDMKTAGLMTNPQEGEGGESVLPLTFMDDEHTEG